MSREADLALVREYTKNENLVRHMLAVEAAVRADYVIRGATLYDGSGKPGRKGDLAIKGDRIVALVEGSGRLVEKRYPATPLTAPAEPPAAERAELVTAGAARED